MSTIHLLSESTINKIAAGEVVENPASVVKELVENALDARAKKIEVQIRGGGLQLIRIADDGIGMSREDALLSIERHATSKIRSAEDLFHVMTMGFRGEALASIASISKLTMMTALEGEEGVRVEIEGGKIVEVAPYARNRGTTLEVRSLFYNVPARKKFQKSPAHCASEVSKVMTLFGLAQPEVAFVFFKQDRELFNLSAEQGAFFYERASLLLESSFSEGSFKISEGPLQGVIASPMQSRMTRSGQYLFINRRPIFSPLIHFAVKDGYGTRIAENRFPLFVLHLTIAPERIDVNVHPQKKEVRFQDIVGVKEMVREAVSRALDKPLLAPLWKERREGFFPLSKGDFTIPFEEKSCPAPFRCKEEPILEKKQELPITMPKATPLAVFGHYLVLEDAGKLLLVDLLAARASLVYEKVSKQRVEKQGLLLPETFDLSLQDAARVSAYKDALEEVGIVIRAVGPSSFMVEAIPLSLEPEDLRDSILAIVQELEKEEGEDRLVKLASALSHTSRRFKRHFMLQEARVLYEEVVCRNHASLCPRGKPIMVYLNDEQIAKLFSRKL